MDCRRIAPGLAVVLGLGLSLAPGAVRAGGFTIPLVGARMAAQGAFATRPDDASAIYHNPAGLTLLRGLRFDASGTGILTNTAYRRSDYPQKDVDGTLGFDTSRAPAGPCPEVGAAEGYDAQGYVLSPCHRPEVSPASRFGTIPFAGIAVNPDLWGLAFGLGVYSPHNAAAEFPEDGAQRYDVIDGSITTLYITPSVAWRPHAALAVGAGFSFVRAAARYRRSYWLPASLTGLNPEEIQFDLGAEGWTQAWDAGLIFFPGELVPALSGLELAVVYVSRAKLEFEGDIDVTGVGAQLGPMFDTNYQEGQTIHRGAETEFTVPDSVKVGIGWSFGERAWVGADVYWNHYSLYDALVIRLDEPLGSIEEFVQPKDSSDSWTVTVGGRVTPWPSLDVRLGCFLDESPYPDETYTILSPDADKLGVSTGLSWRPGLGLELSVAYMLLLYADRKVTDSRIRPEIELEMGTFTYQESAPFSANGEVTDKIVHVMGLQLGWAWDFPGEGEAGAAEATGGAQAAAAPAGP